MRKLLLLPLLTLAACDGDDSRADVDMSGDPAGPERFAIVSEDGDLKLALTDEQVFFALSDERRAEAKNELADDVDGDGEGIGAVVGGLVREGVSRALDFKASYELERIEDIRWENDRVVIEFTDGTTGPGDNWRIDDEPVDEAFSEEDIRAFAREFRDAKASISTRPDTGSTDDVGAD